MKVSDLSVIQIRCLLETIEQIVHDNSSGHHRLERIITELTNKDLVIQRENDKQVFYF